MKLIDITKGSEHDLSLFSEEKIAELESRIIVKAGKKSSVPSLSAIKGVNQQVMRFTSFYSAQKLESGYRGQKSCH